MSNKRKKRNEGLDEITEIIDDMDFLYTSISKKGKRAKKIFSKYEKKCFAPYQDQYLHLLIEYQLEAYNCAYENTLAQLQFEKELKEKSYLQYLGRKLFYS